MCNRYENMYGLSRPVYPDRPAMSIHDRAAQFSPFAALTGYDDAVEETARITDDMIQLTEDRAQQLNDAINRLRECVSKRPEVTVTYFIHDGKKQGGSFAEKTGTVRVLDEVGRILIFTDKSTMPIDDICDMTIED